MVNYRFILLAIFVLTLLVFFCEYLIYYLTYFTCKWPKVNLNSQNSYLNALILTDVHILGPRKGHWFDAFKRELQMSSAFRAASQIFQPELYIFLGDQFDEGLTASDEEFKGFVEYFEKIFPTSGKLRILIPGNHDIGFHDRFVYYDTYYLKRFKKMFNINDVQLITLNGINFVALNSMALEGDGCYLCNSVISEIKNVAQMLKLEELKEGEHKKSRPILIQHFPFFRETDLNCKETDSPPQSLRNRIYEPKIDCVSKEATEFILKTLSPRLAFSGHTHSGCIINHTLSNTIEYSVASFNARNRQDPNFLLARFSKKDFFINKCFLPTERMIIFSYILGLIFIFILLS